MSTPIVLKGPRKLHPRASPLSVPRRQERPSPRSIHSSRRRAPVFHHGYVAFSIGVLTLTLVYNARTIRDITIEGVRTLQLTGSFFFLGTSSMRTYQKPIVRIIRTNETRFNGLGAQALRQIDALAYAKVQHASLQILETRYWNYGCEAGKGWSCYFIPTEDVYSVNDSTASDDELQCSELMTTNGLSPLNSRSLPRDCRLVSRPESSRTVAKTLEAIPYPESLEKARELARLFWRINQDTQDKVTVLLHDIKFHFGVHPSSRYIGVHIRRGDKGKEKVPIPIEEYVASIKAIDSNGMPLFLASDDGRVLQQLKQYFPDRTIAVVRTSKVRKGHLQRDLNRQRGKATQRAVVELLAEIEMLRSATWFIGTFSSNLGRLVHVLRSHDPKTSISLDDRWAPGVAYKTFGQPYCEWSGANEHYCSSMAYMQSVSDREI